MFGYEILSLLFDSDVDYSLIYFVIVQILNAVEKIMKINIRINL